MSALAGTVLYDGACGFCSRSVEWLRPRVPEVEFVSFRDPGVLARFPQVTAEECERAMQYVDPRGGVHAGAEAFVRTLAHKPLWKWTYAYYVPGIRQITDAVYRWVARNRFRFGRSATCTTHRS